MAARAKRLRLMGDGVLRMLFCIMQFFERWVVRGVSALLPWKGNALHNVKSFTALYLMCLVRFGGGLCLCWSSCKVLCRVRRGLDFGFGRFFWGEKVRVGGVCFALLMGMAVSVPAAAQDRVFNATEYFLDNGMQIVVIPNMRAPVVTHMVWYKVGAADEPRGKSGIAHFLEHLMFKGSTYIDKEGAIKGLPPGAFSEAVKKLGGRDNAFTSQDYTAYFQSVAVEHLETVMRMEAGRMRGMSPPLEEVLSERKVILEERAQRTDNNPQAKFSEQLNSALYVNHPYGNPVIGWAHEIAALSWEDAKAMYDRYYAPDNAILVVTGDVQPAVVKALAEDIYGHLKPSGIGQVERERIVSPPLPGALAVNMAHPAVRQPIVQLLMRAPSARQNMKESLALEVLSQIMSGGNSARLYKSLVVEQKLATTVSMGYSGTSYDDGEVWLYGVPAKGVEPVAVVSALKAALLRLIKDGVGDEELASAIKQLQSQAIFARDSLSGPARIVGQNLASGVSLDDVETWPAQIAAVSAADVALVARKYLNPAVYHAKPSVIGYLRPEVREE